MKFIGVLALVAVAAGLVHFSTPDSGAESLTHYVADNKVAPDIGRVENSDEAVSILIDRNSIKEVEEEGITFRTATVIYHFDPPVTVKGKSVHFLVSNMAYHCDSKMFITSAAVLYDEDSVALFKVTEPTTPEVAEEGTNPAAELKYVCEFKTKKTSPKGKPATKQKYTDI